MNLNFYLAQISSFFGWIFLIYSYWRNKSNKILYLQLVACIFFCVNYLFLGAYTGLFVVFFEIIRDYLYIKLEDDKKTFLFTLPIYIIIGIFSYNGILSIFPIIASISDGYALIHKGKKVVFLGIITYLLWIIYDIYCFSLPNIIAEATLILSNIIILLRHKQLEYNIRHISVNKRNE